MKFISLIDNRLSQETISLKSALRLRRYHDQVFGDFKCIIEDNEGFELEDKDFTKA